jgi:hypothetical protein
MRLIDRFHDAPELVELKDSKGRIHQLPGAGHKKDALATCPLRFVLDQSASEQCHNLALEADILLGLAPNILRLPASTFWIEWIATPATSDEPDMRFGALIETDEGGREGLITPFFDAENGQLETVCVGIKFDLDHELVGASGRAGSFQIEHDSLATVHGLLRHMQFQYDPSWARFHRLSAHEVLPRLQQEAAETGWLFFPLVLAFVALLNSGGALDERPSDFTRLNAKRSRCGKHPLLEHIEVKMTLGNSPRQGNNYAGAGSRSHPRLHPVRGHLVHRAGKIFWRSAHVRGDMSRPILSRTARVTGGRTANPFAPSTRGPYPVPPGAIRSRAEPFLSM